MALIKILASQPSSIYLYKNLRTKVIKRRANIYFNRLCLAKEVIQNSAKISYS
jgi:hypothetical protein